MKSMSVYVARQETYYVYFTFPVRVKCAWEVLA